MNAIPTDLKTTIPQTIENAIAGIPVDEQCAWDLKGRCRLQGLCGLCISETGRPLSYDRVGLSIGSGSGHVNAYRGQLQRAASDATTARMYFNADVLKPGVSYSGLEYNNRRITTFTISAGEEPDTPTDI